MYKICFIVALLFGCATAGTSAARPQAPPRTKAFTPEMYLGLQEVRDVRISPDGGWVAYELSVPRDGKSAKPRREIWLVAATGGAPRRLSARPFDAWSPRWSPDGKSLAFLSQRKGYHKKPQVFALALGGGEAAPLTKHKTGVDAFAWSPDGKRIAFAAMERKSKKRRAEDKAGKDWTVAGSTPQPLRGLWILDVAARAPRASTQVVGGMHVLDMAWSPQGERMLVVASPRADADAEMMEPQIYRLDLGGAAAGEPVPLTRREGKLGHPVWSPDGTQIAFPAAVDVNDPTAGSVFVMPAEGGEARHLTEGFPGTVHGLDWLDAGTLLVAAVEGPRTGLYRLPVARGRMERIAAGEAMCYQPRLAADRQRVACVASAPWHPGEVYAGRIGRGSPTRLTTSNPALETVRFAPQEVIRWKSVDGLEIEGVLIRPRPGQAGDEAEGQAAQRHPLVVLPHGGPEGSRENGWLGYPGQLLAARGYAVLYPNYRGSSGRGVAFSKGDHEDLGGKEFDDILAGIDHLAGLGLVDPARVGIGGWSYGGYLSAWAGTRHSERFVAAIMGAGISNWISFTGNTDIPREMSVVHWALWPFENLDLAWQRSPMAHLGKAKTPMLILHGGADARVPVGQAWEMYRGLKQVGVDTELVIYPRAGHGVQEQAHRADMVQRFLGWFDQYLKPGGAQARR